MVNFEQEKAAIDHGNDCHERGAVRHRSSPLEVNILLHIYAIAEPFPDEDAPAQSGILSNFVEMGVVQKDAIRTGSGYKTTEKGNAWVDAILAVPMPVIQWVIPKEEER